MRSRRLSIFSLCVGIALTACVGSAYLPGDPGSPNSDISGNDFRTLWLTEHPDVSEDIRAAIEQGVFVAGMTIEERDVVTNSDRRGTTGDGYWRSIQTGIDVRYQWFVGGTREPFKDGLDRKVCELIFQQNVLSEVRYCGLPPDASS